MGQIQNAISGAVSSIVGAQVASNAKAAAEELKLKRAQDQEHQELNQKMHEAAGGVKAVTERAAAYNQKEANLAKEKDEYFKQLISQDPNNQKAQDLVKEKFQTADDELAAEKLKIQGWQGRVQEQLNWLKAKGLDNVEFETKIAAANDILGGKQ